MGDADGARYSSSDPMDSAWHEIILHIKLYEAVCKALAGEMMHHDPSGALECNDEERTLRRRATSAAHLVLFGCAETVDFDTPPAVKPKKRKTAEPDTVESKSLGDGHNLMGMRGC